MIKKVLTFLKKVPKKAYAAAALAVIAGTVPFIVHASTPDTQWGPDRPTYAYNNGTSLGSTTGPVFDSFTGVPDYGDEREFATVRQAGTGDWQKSIDVTPGEEIQVRAYVHNNANSATNGTNFDGIGVAHNTAVRFYVPSGDGNQFQVAAYISASNATPQRVYNTVAVDDNNEPVSLSYVAGSAVLYNYGPFANGTQVPDSVVSGSGNGALIGYNALDGNLPGCFDYRETVIVTLKVNAPALKFTKQVATPTSGWTSSVSSQTGSTVSWLLNYENTGTDTMNDLTVRDPLPKDLTLVPGTITWFDTAHPNGKVLPDTALTGSGVDLGSYAANSGGYLKFHATISQDPSTCTITNTAFASAQSISEQSSQATVNVSNCQPTIPKTPTFACDLLSVSKEDNRTVKITGFQAPGANGATFSNAVIDWGDGSQALTTNNVAGQTYTYAKDGSYTITATAHFAVSGQDKTATSPACTQTVSFTTTPPTTPLTPSTPTVLPNTGMNLTQIITAVLAASTFGAVAHHLIMSRRLAQEAAGSDEE